MDADCTEIAQNQSHCQMLDEAAHCTSDPSGYNDTEKLSSVISEVSVSLKSVEISDQTAECDNDQTVQTFSDVKMHTEIDQGAEKPSVQLEMDHTENRTDISANFRDCRPTDIVVNDTADVNQSQASVQELWRPSNPFLGVADGSIDAGGRVTPNSVSSSSFAQTLTPADIGDGVTDSSPMSASAPSDMVTDYSKLRESAPSSVCSASPYESPTHAASGGAAADSATDAVGNRPDSLYLSRSILQERERQWLAKKGSYSSLSECDSSPGGSMDALIEAATSTPLHAQGTVSMEGDMITFVADGINELIKRSRGGIYNLFATIKLCYSVFTLIYSFW